VECLSSYPGSLGKISSAVEANSPQLRVTDSNSKNAVNFSSAPHNETLSVAAMCVSNEDCAFHRQPFFLA